jgi:Arc/MetJ-type ribon-helix-helix transcriptional regulator
MRHIINISLPAELNQEVEKAIKTGRFATKSEFFRHLLRIWQEDQLLKQIAENRREIAVGKGKVLKSLKDLR